MMQLFKTVDAHCDVPCGIYETDTMRNAAHTTKVMMQKIAELGAIDNPEKMNSFVRMVQTKEDHAETVKRQVAILWGDYFKPEHLEKVDDLHDTMWRTLKAASQVKQTISVEAADHLVEMVAKVEELFRASRA